MKTVCLLGTILVFCIANAAAQGKDDPLTGLPVIPAAETIVAGKSYGFQPAPMPPATVCKSKMKGDFYSISGTNVKDSKVKVNAVVAWYESHLTGFKKMDGYVANAPQNAGHRSQTAFYNSDGTVVIFVTGAAAPQGEIANTYSVAYQRYEPGISEKTIASMASSTQGKIACQ
jgi:hypothetical protein